MRALSSIAAFAFLLAPPLVAQATPTKDQLVGTWITVISGRGSAGARPNTEYYLTLYAGGAYMVQAKAKGQLHIGVATLGGATDSMVGGSGDSAWIAAGGSIKFRGKTDSLTGGSASTPGESSRVWGQWALVGDSLKFGRDGIYARFRAVLQGPELTLQQAKALGPDDVVKNYQECTQVFTRVDPSQPLPAPRPIEDCQTVARPFPWSKLKAADLVGTWASMSAFGAVRPAPFCGDFEECFVGVDTLTMQADSTLVHNFVRTRADDRANNKSDTTRTKTTVKLRWWVASDTLWTAPMTEPDKKQAIRVRLEDDGRYAIYNFDYPVYRRVTLSKP